MAWKRRGNLIATALAGVWRHPSPELRLSIEELSDIAPILFQSGGAALGWRRISQSDWQTSPLAFQLQQAYRLHRLQSAIHERELLQIVTLLKSAGWEPLLGKGWAVARLYPEQGLRPYGDFDLYVRAEEYSAVMLELRNFDAKISSVDLHCGVSELNDRGLDQLYRRAQLVTLGELNVRVFGPEDHLRLLCLHMFHHGAWRPLWLCDIAVAFENRPTDFDWDYFLSGDQRRTDAVRCAIGLAHQLLGACVEGTPVEKRAKQLPSWLVPAVLRQWGRGQSPHGTRMPMAHYLRHPSGGIEALRIRWPNAIEATVNVHGPFNELPRLPFQVGECLRRTARFALKLPKSVW